MNPKNLTYEQLAEFIARMTADQRAMNVSIYLEGADEFYPVTSTEITRDSDILDAGHPYLVIEA